MFSGVKISRGNKIEYFIFKIFKLFSMFEYRDTIVPICIGTIGIYAMCKRRYRVPGK